MLAVVRRLGANAEPKFTVEQGYFCTRPTHQLYSVAGDATKFRG